MSHILTGSYEGTLMRSCKRHSCWRRAGDIVHADQAKGVDIVELGNQNRIEDVAELG